LEEATGEHFEKLIENTVGLHDGCG
jgi:hypothetical protein